jgi:hypothetical protein
LGKIIDLPVEGERAEEGIAGIGGDVRHVAAQKIFAGTVFRKAQLNLIPKRNLHDKGRYVMQRILPPAMHRQHKV